MPTLDISRNLTPLIQSKGKLVHFTMVTGHEFSGRVQTMEGSRVDLSEAVFYDGSDEHVLYQLELPLDEIAHARLL